MFVQKFIDKIKKPEHLVKLLSKYKPEAVEGNHGFGAYQFIYRFENNYGALVFTGGYGTGSWDNKQDKENPYELCVLRFKNQSHYALYRFEIPAKTKVSETGTFGYLKEPSICSLLDEIKRLEKSSDEENPSNEVRGKE